MFLAFFQCAVLEVLPLSFWCARFLMVDRLEVVQA